MKYLKKGIVSDETQESHFQSTLQQHNHELGPVTEDESTASSVDDDEDRNHYKLHTKLR